MCLELTLSFIAFKGRDGGKAAWEVMHAAGLTTFLPKGWRLGKLQTDDVTRPILDSAGKETTAAAAYEAYCLQCVASGENEC